MKLKLIQAEDTFSAFLGSEILDNFGDSADLNSNPSYE